MSFVVLPSALVAASVAVRGVQLHWGRQAPYKPSEGISTAQQLDLAHDLLGPGGWVRTAISSDQLADWRSELQPALEGRSLSLLALLNHDNASTDDPAQLHAEARAEARNVSNAVCGIAAGRHVFELSNELDLKCMKHDGIGRNGMVVDDYNQTAWRRYRAILSGLAAGVADGCGARAERVINTGGWLHFGFLELLRQAAIPYEIVAWHWYSEMGLINCTSGSAAGGCFDVAARLASYNRTIWVTETDRRFGSSNKTSGNETRGGELQQARVLGGLLDNFGALPTGRRLEAVFVYEALDQPQLEPSPEAEYGLQRVGRAAPAGPWALGEPKRAFETVRQWARGTGRG